MKETTKNSVTKASLVFLLMLVIGAPGYAFDDDPYLRDAAPIQTENRSDHEALREFVKMKLLEGLGIAEPPDISKEPTVILKDDVRSLNLSGYRPMKHNGTLAEAPLTQSTRRFSRIIVFAELGTNIPCQISKSLLKTYIPVSFKLPSDPSLIHRAILQFKTNSKKRNLKPRRKVWICSCTTSGNRVDNGTMSTPKINANCSNMDPTVDILMQAAQCQQLPVMNEDNSSTPEVTTRWDKAGWSNVLLADNWKSFVSKDRRLFFLLDGKSSITDRVRPSLVLEVEKEMPLEKPYPLRMKRADQELEVGDCEDGGAQSSSLQCCRSNFYVSIEELGWSDWVFSPTGFHYYFCTGQCTNGFDRFVKGGAVLDYSMVINAMIERQQIKNIRPCCAARKTSSLNIVMLTDTNSIKRTHIPNFIVDECACIGFS